MLQQLPAKTLHEWMLFWEQVGGWGPERSELETGIIASTIANAAPFRKRRKSFHPRHFMPVHGKRRAGRRQTDAEIFAAIDVFLGDDDGSDGR